jgi:hypothetical protein
LNTPWGRDSAARRTFEHYRAELDMRLAALRRLDDMAFGTWLKVVQPTAR